MTIPGSAPFASAPYGAQPVVPVSGPEGGPYTVMTPAISTILPSALRIATVGSADTPNPGYKGVMVILSVSAASGTGGLQVLIEGRDPLNAGYYVLNATPAAIINVNTAVYVLYPGASGVAGNVTQATSLPLPDTWRVAVVHLNATNYTYSVQAVLLP